AVTTETKGVISRCQVGPSQAVIVVPDRVDTANMYRHTPIGLIRNRIDATSIQQYQAATFPARKTHPLEKSSAQCIDSLPDSLQISSQVAKTTRWLSRM
ncbi:hypothetical protein, partial [Mycobacteroides abscessus]|uniref:hypothetical protein n=1 Tax=Mycobacteroides abscessus TaxID=36809 RepID=UPI001C2C92B0